MRIFAGLVLAGALALGSLAPQAALAAAPRLGSTIDQVQSAYPTAALQAPSAGKQTLRLTNIDYAGLNWGSVEFVFDVSHRLEAVRLTTTRESFATVQKLLATTLSSGSGLIDASDFMTEAFQIRICESSVTGVTLTLERESFDA